MLQEASIGRELVATVTGSGGTNDSWLEANLTANPDVVTSANFWASRGRLATKTELLLPRILHRRVAR